MAVIDPKKLLPDSSKTTSILIPKKNVSLSAPSSLSLKPADKTESVGGSLVVKKLIKIDEILQDTLKVKKDKEKKEDQIKKKEKRDNRETALEAKKDKKKKADKMFNIPKGKGIDWISDWLTWTIVGFLFNNFKDLVGYLKPIWDIAKTLGTILYKVFTAIVSGVTAFIELGYNAYNSIEELIGGLGGEDAKKVFNDMSGALTTALNVAIIGLMLAGSTGGFGRKKPGGGRTPGRGGPRTRGPRVTQSGGGNANRFGLRNPLRQRPGVTQGGAGTRVTQAVGNRLTGRGAARVTTGAGSKVAGKLGLKAAGRTLKPILSKVPFVGGLLEFFLSWALGDPIGKAAFRGVGMTLGSWIGGLLGTLIPIPFVGSAIGAFLGGMGAAELAGLMYDGIFGSKNAPKPKVEKKQGGGTVGSTQKPNRGGRGISKRKKKTQVSKVQKVQTLPGKDFAGKKRIEEFYGKDEGLFNTGLGAGKNTPYDALMDSSKVAKENRSLNGVIGSLIGTGIDLTLGQKPSAKSIDEISNTLSTFVQASMQMEMDRTVQSVRELFTLNEGGSVPANRAISRTETDPVSTMKDQITRGISASISRTSTEIFSKIRLAMSGKKEADKERERQNAANNNAYSSAQYGSGVSITGGSADFWTLAAITALESGNAQGRADVAQSIYNRQRAGAANGYPGGPSLKGMITHGVQYQPVRQGDRALWEAITDKETAIAAINSVPHAAGKGKQLIEAAAAAITDTSLQNSARDFVGARTDFTTPDQMSVHGAHRGTHRADEAVRGGHVFGWFVGPGAVSYGTKIKGKGAAAVPDLQAMRTEAPTITGGADEIINAVPFEDFSDPTGNSLVGVSGTNNMYRTAARPNHMGIDIGTRNTPGYFVALKLNGKVTVNQTQGGTGGGHFVAIESGGKEYFFMHLARPSHLKIGQNYTAGQIIGEIGNSGSRDIHLHYEVRVNNKHINPKPYLNLLIIGKKNPNPNPTPTTQPSTPAAVSPLTSAIPTATGLGRQGTTATTDYGRGADAGAKGYIIVPGHAAGGGAPGEMELTPALARNIVENVKRRVGSNVPIKVLDMHGSTANTDSAFTVQQNQLKSLEQQGYEVIELHMDASLESGVGTGRGVILPMPGTDAINPVEADFARTAGAFAREHRGGLAGTNRGVSLIELGNMSPELQRKVLRGGGLTKQELDKLTRPLEDSLIRGMGLQEQASLGAPRSREVASLQRTPDYAEGQATLLLQKQVYMVG